MIRLPENIPNFKEQQVNLKYVTEEWSQPERLQTFKYLQEYFIWDIVDIGANVGVFSDLCLENFDYLETLRAFEPDIDNYNILTHNINDPTFFPFNCGIFYGQETGKVLQTQVFNPGGEIFEEVSREHLYPHQDTLTIREGKEFTMFPLEKFITLPPNLIKLDVEGSEYNIIENSLVIQHTKFLIIEFHGHNDSYLEKYLKEKLPNHTLRQLTNEYYNTDHHYYSFLQRK